MSIGKCCSLTTFWPCLQIYYLQLTNFISDSLLTNTPRFILVFHFKCHLVNCLLIYLFYERGWFLKKAIYRFWYLPFLLFWFLHDLFGRLNLTSFYLTLFLFLLSGRCLGAENFASKFASMDKKKAGTQYGNLITTNKTKLCVSTNIYISVECIAVQILAELLVVMEEVVCLLRVYFAVDIMHCALLLISPLQWSNEIGIVLLLCSILLVCLQ